MNIKLLATLVVDDPKAPFSKATIPRSEGGLYYIPWIIYEYND